MKLFKSIPLFDRYTGKKTDQTEKTCTGLICDLCGVELDNDFNIENYPNVAFEIHDIGGCEPYFHEDRLKYTVEEALELFEIDWDDEIEADNYMLFNDNPYTYCQERDCLQSILRKALSEDAQGAGLWLENEMMKARLEMVDRVLRQKLFTFEQLGISFED